MKNLFATIFKTIAYFFLSYLAPFVGFFISFLFVWKNGIFTELSRMNAIEELIIVWGPITITTLAGLYSAKHADKWWLKVIYMVPTVFVAYMYWTYTQTGSILPF
ncbi:MAG: hypothetical protein AAB909_02025 [Patescibacteria group bacterium]